MKNILITGGSGLLATNWAQIQRLNFNITLGIHNRNVELNNVKNEIIKFDSIDSIELSIKKIKPDIIIHTAALSDVEFCEKNLKLANETNVIVSKNIALLCTKYNIKLIHISTDHLFDGTKSFLPENSISRPLNVYGRTKADAEIAVSLYCKNALIIRTNFFGWGPLYKNSFSDLIINKLRKNEHINLFNDVFYTPILISELVRIVHLLIEFNEKGIFNVFGNERISKCDFGLKLAKIFNLNNSLINSVSIKDRNDLVKRPLDMSMSNTKLNELKLNNILSLEEQLIELNKSELFSISKELKIV